MKINSHILVLVALVVLPSVIREANMTNGKGFEPPEFWTAVANDAKLEAWQRETAIYRLYERHIQQDITLGELGSILNNPTWIKEEDVYVVTAVGGWIPLKMTPGDTMFCVLVFSNGNAEQHNRECIAIYMNIEGKIDETRLLTILMHRAITNDADRRLKAWAFAPTWEEFLRTTPPR